LTALNRARGRRILTGGVFAAGAGLLLAAAVAAPGAGRSVRAGGTFRISEAGIDSIDPALSVNAGIYLGATCAQLMHYVDKSLPEGRRIVAEAATGYPRVSRDAKTFTFTIRKGLRFSDGKRLTAQAFAHEINRILDPAMHSGFVAYAQDIVGAQDVIDGKAKTAKGVRASGSTLVLELVAPAPDLPARLTLFAFCAVPPNLPADPEGARAPLPAAGPYYIAQYVPGRKLVLKRNRFYRGNRPHHVDRVETIFVDSVHTALKLVQQGRADLADGGSATDYAELLGKYRVNKSQLFRLPGLGLRMVVMNTSQPLFRNNPKLRQAVNFALNRRALLRERGPETGELTDQYLPPGVPGFRNEHIYPLRRPDLARAKPLARGRTRGGKATLYTTDSGPGVPQAQIVKANLRQIGIDVTIKKFPGPALFGKIFTAGERWDITFLGWFPDYFDPADILGSLLDGRYVPKAGSYGSNWAYFNSPKYNRLLRRAAQLSGTARYREYGRLDIQIARNEAPLASYEVEDVYTFVSKRAGCLVLNPSLDLSAVCLK
jgi:peptide/nickel transport system substrate-binding protein